MSVLEFVLAPVVGLMESILNFYVHLFSSTGVSILLLSFTFAMLLLPVQKKVRRFEQRIITEMQAVEKEVQRLGRSLKGEQRFLAIEQIYYEHGYHPIKSIGMGASFFVMLPILISAILLFTSDALLANKSFLFIDDLAKPDGLLGPVNVLPLVMSAITVIDAKLRFKDDKKSQYRFLFIAVVLLAIVYNLASGLVLYWTGSNLVSLVVSRVGSK